jgi:hypothetical protein
MKSILVEQGILDGQPIVAVSYLEPIGDWDSGLAASSSEPNQTRDCKPGHIGCFLDQHPEAGRGLGLAHEHGEAVYDGSEWKPIKRTGSLLFGAGNCRGRWSPTPFDQPRKTGPRSHSTMSPTTTSGHFTGQSAYGSFRAHAIMSTVDWITGPRFRGLPGDGGFRHPSGVVRTESPSTRQVYAEQG